MQILFPKERLHRFDMRRLDQYNKTVDIAEFCNEGGRWADDFFTFFTPLWKTCAEDPDKLLCIFLRPRFVCTFIEEFDEP